MTWYEVFARFESKYWADSGLARLDLQDTQILYDLETVSNENGILFLAFTLIAAFESANESQKQKILELKPRVIRIIQSLQRYKDTPGFYNRQPKHNIRSEAHDNYVGISALCALFDIQEPVNGMISYAWHNKFCFNNVEPGKFSWAQFRQPGEVALYYMAAKHRSPFIFTLWLLVGLYLSGRSKLDPGRTQLPWLRLWTIDKVKGPKGFIQRLLYNKTKAYWFKQLTKHYTGIRTVQMVYYKDIQHPINLFNIL